VAHFELQCGGNWVALVHDDYTRHHLCTHLTGAERWADLFSLVTGSDAWATAREAVDEGYGGYLADLALTWQRAESDVGWNVGQQVRCALIESSICSLAGNIFLELLVQLVETGLWSPARALVLISQMANAWQQADALASLAPRLPEALLPEALAAAVAIEDTDAKVKALRGLAPYLSETQRSEALAAALAIKDAFVKALAVSALAYYYLSEAERTEVVREALAAAVAIEDTFAQAAALSALAPHLNESQRAEVLAVAFTIKDAFDKVMVLNAIAPQLPAERQMTVLGDAYSIIAQVGLLRNELLDSLMATWITIGFAGLTKPMWCTQLHKLARERRREFMEDLAAMAPLIRHLGGQEALVVLVQVICESTSWWP
jgi:hypothetical protein